MFMCLLCFPCQDVNCTRTEVLFFPIYYFVPREDHGTQHVLIEYLWKEGREGRQAEIKLSDPSREELGLELEETKNGRVENKL